MEATDVLDRALERSRLSVRQRTDRLRANAWHVVQCAVAAGVAYFVAHDLLGHASPFLAPVAAVLCLGTSYGQRVGRVAEVTVGVAIGVLLSDTFVNLFGSGGWQISFIAAGGMSVAMLLGAGRLFQMQATVQGITVAILAPAPGAAFTRWTDALVGGAVALVAATVAPQTPLRRPRQQAAVVVDKIKDLLHAAADIMVDGNIDRALELLSTARATDSLIGELQAAADEGLAVVATSPFRRRHREPLRKMADMVEPLDLALRNTRVVVRRATVAAYRHESVPPGYSALCHELAEATAVVADELRGSVPAGTAQELLLRVGAASSQVHGAGVTSGLSSEAILAQVRSIIADLLRITGMGVIESTEAIPPMAS